MIKKPKIFGVELFIFGFVGFVLTAMTIGFSFGVGQEPDILAGAIVLGILDAACIFFMIRYIIRTIRRRKLFNTGIVATAKFIKGYSNTTVNGVRLYNIDYIFSPGSGVNVTHKSPAMYTLREMEYLKAPKYFKIKHNNKISVISQDLFAPNTNSNPKPSSDVPPKPAVNEATTVNKSAYLQKLNETIARAAAEKNMSNNAAAKPSPKQTEAAPVKTEAVPAKPKAAEQIPAAPAPSVPAGNSPADKIINSLRNETTAEGLDKVWESASPSLEFSDYIKVKREYEDIKRNLE